MNLNLEGNKGGDEGLETLICVEKAAQNLKFPNRRIGIYKDILLVEIPEKTLTLRFWRNRHPFNTASNARICGDKFLQFQFFTEFKLPMPKTSTVLNPFIEERYKHYTKFNSLAEVVEYIESEHQYPFICKKPTSSRCRDVHLLHDREDLEKILKQYFTAGTRMILLFQDFIRGEEYRLVTKDGSLKLAYTKKGNVRFDKEKSTSHKIAKCNDDKLLSKFDQLCSAIYKSMGSRFLGIDVIIDKKQDMYILETNSYPICSKYNQEFGREDFILIYQEFLQEYQN